MTEQMIRLLKETDGESSNITLQQTNGFGGGAYFTVTPISAAALQSQINARSVAEADSPLTSYTVGTRQKSSSIFIGTVSLKDDEIKIHEDAHGEYHANTTDYPTTYGDNIKDGQLYVTVKLSDPYLPADVVSDCEELLLTMDLCDDGKFPWRTDLPVWDTNHFTPQLGPSFGPLACWEIDASGNPVMRTANPCGYEPYWDTQHLNELYGDTGGISLCWYVDTRGAHTPDKFGTAQKWMPDLTNNMFLPGAHASFNANPREYNDCAGNPLVLDGKTLYLSKWAEIYISEKFQHHNAARDPNGCLPDDEQTIDPDTIDCITNPTGTLQFPNAADCTKNPLNSTTKVGSYSVKTWKWEASTTPTMICAHGKIQPCVPCLQAVFIQSEPVTGIYQKALRIDPPTISYFDERYDGIPKGYYSLVQFQQSMVDPLWKRPATCVGGLKTEDALALIPYEENTDCESGQCDNYTGSPFNSRCEPDAQYPWAYVAPI